MRAGLVGVLAAVTVGVCACGGGSTPKAVSAPAAAPVSVSSTTATTVAVNYGAKYLAIIGPLNKTLGASTPVTAAQLSTITALIDRTEAQLLAVRWPGQAETDVRSMVTDMGPLAAAVSNDDVAAFRTAGQTVASAAAIVRSDLGLASNLG